MGKSKRKNTGNVLTVERGSAASKRRRNEDSSNSGDMATVVQENAIRNLQGNNPGGIYNDNNNRQIAEKINVTRAAARKLGLEQFVKGNNKTGFPVARSRSRPNSKFECAKVISGFISDTNEEEELDYLDDVDVSVETMVAEDGEFPDDDEVRSNDSSDEGDLEMDQGSGASIVDSEVTFKRRVEPTITPSFQNLRGDPAFETFIKKCVAQEFKQASKKGQGHGDAKSGRTSIIPQPRVKSVVQKPTAATGKNPNSMPNTPAGAGIVLNSHAVIMKSPSDTTLYAPALNRAVADPTRQLVNKILSPTSRDVEVTGFLPQSNPTDMSRVQTEALLRDSNMDNSGNGGQFTVTEEQIARFIEGVRIQNNHDNENNQIIVTDKGVPAPVPGTSRNSGVIDEYANNLEVARQKANQIILEAERYKATVNNPPGIVNESLSEPVNILNTVNSNTNMHNPAIVNKSSSQMQGVAACPPAHVGCPSDDDEFFHVTCHLEEPLRGENRKR